MDAKVVAIPVEEITDWDTFHDVFGKALGFPDFYGRNMNAWVDCMTSLDEPEEGMTTVTVAKGGVVILRIDSANDFQKRRPELYDALVECAAFVNWPRIKRGAEPVLGLMLSGYD